MQRTDCGGLGESRTKKPTYVCISVPRLKEREKVGERRGTRIGRRRKNVPEGCIKLVITGNLRIRSTSVHTKCITTLCQRRIRERERELGRKSPVMGPCKFGDATRPLGQVHEAGSVQNNELRGSFAPQLNDPLRRPP